MQGSLEIGADEPHSHAAPLRSHPSNMTSQAKPGAKLSKRASMPSDVLRSMAPEAEAFSTSTTLAHQPTLGEGSAACLPAHPFYASYQRTLNLPVQECLSGAARMALHFLQNKISKVQTLNGCSNLAFQRVIVDLPVLLDQASSFMLLVEGGWQQMLRVLSSRLSRIPL